MKRDAMREKKEFTNVRHLIEWAGEEYGERLAYSYREHPHHGEVSVDVKNTGTRAGKEAVLLYSSDLVASITPDNKRLRDFTKVELQAGETKTVAFRLPAKNLAFVGADGRWTLEEGDFLLRVGGLQVPTQCIATKTWDEPNI